MPIFVGEVSEEISCLVKAKWGLDRYKIPYETVQFPYFVPQWISRVAPHVLLMDTLVWKVVDPKSAFPVLWSPQEPTVRSSLLT